MMKKFIYDVILDASNICNLDLETKAIQQKVTEGHRLVIYGRRNTGKTSLIQSIILPRYLSKNKKHLVVDVDMMGVHSLEEIKKRLRIAFERGLSKANPGQSYLATLMKSIRGIRPTLNVNPTSGELNFSLGIDAGSREPELEDLFAAVIKYHKTQRALIVFDEFQDIAEIKDAQAAIRGALQRLPSDLPVIILGSKKNLLAKIFAVPQAPLAGWGQDIQIPDLENAAYQKKYHYFINERLDSEKMQMPIHVAIQLMKKAQFIPETVNIVCDVLLSDSIGANGQIQWEQVLSAFQKAVDQRRGRYEERLSFLRTTEQDVLVAMAKNEPISKLKGKDFLKHLRNISPSAVYKITQSLERRSDLHQTSEGYVLADALFAEYLRQFR